MIVIGGYPVSPAAVDSFSQLTAAQKQTAKKMAASRETFYYASNHQFIFEAAMRTNIVAAAYALKDSGAAFATFRNARCNPVFWQLTGYGGFLMRRDVSPSAAITDIFFNGRKYGFECTTAIMIMFYKAVLETSNARIFDQLFSGILLYSTEHDEDLQIMAYPNGDPMPGDVLYVKNPQHDPMKPQWQGENIVDLGNGLFFGHGIGVGSLQEIIGVLNTKRRPGATVSAYLTDDIIRPNYRLMSEYIRNPVRRLMAEG
ncbi:protein-glutamine gamma-glutamyltransferase [Fictibacillus iocasae]|uniref:Protein-glutamine gamma-glutamyltransferase n=1 Tax=Fictibacillus iocasae TaxID=2715437 RepID=A0ABW2NKE3_9BACL